MNQTPRHKVFVSHHIDDKIYVDKFVEMMDEDIVDKSVHDNDIDDRNLKTTTIRQKIRDDFISDATVTVVLIGPMTYTRKHVDWEIGSSLRKTRKNSRCGLLGILLPNHPSHPDWRRDIRLIPPRLASNLKGNDPYAQIYNWPQEGRRSGVRRWIHKAFQRRSGTPPNNGLKPFVRNRRPIDPRGPVGRSDEFRRRPLNRRILR